MYSLWISFIKIEITGEGNGISKLIYIFLVSILLFLCVCLFKAAPMAYGGSQARSQIGGVAADLHHSRSNAGFKLHLQPTLQRMATRDP